MPLEGEYAPGRGSRRELMLAARGRQRKSRTSHDKWFHMSCLTSIFGFNCRKRESLVRERACKDIEGASFHVLSAELVPQECGSSPTPETAVNGSSLLDDSIGAKVMAGSAARSFAFDRETVDRLAFSEP